MSRGFERRSVLPGVSVEEVWARVSTWDGVNHELGPTIRMSFPARFSNIDEIPADGASHFTSTLSLFGVLPFDRHRFVLRGLATGEHFDECSSNALLRSWEHYRAVTPVDGGVEVLDRCRLVPRIPGTGAFLAWVYGAIFRRRHRRLVAWFASRTRAA